jgi:hypothetical protein
MYHPAITSLWLHVSDLEIGIQRLYNNGTTFTQAMFVISLFLFA